MLNEIIGPRNEYTEKEEGDGLCKEFKPEFPFLATKNTSHPDMAVFPRGDHRSYKYGPDHDESGGFLHSRGRPLEKYPGHNLYENKYRHGDNGGYAPSIFRNEEDPQNFIGAAFQFDSPNLEGGLTRPPFDV